LSYKFTHFSNNITNENNSKKDENKMIGDKLLVVTSILEHDNRVLILKRSEKIKSYKHKWSCISGYFENNEDLLSRALIEIYEETGISKDDMTLIRILQQVKIELENNKLLTIQPFFFSSKTNIISLNWENSDYKWIKEEQVKNYDTVPKLTNMLHNCFTIIKKGTI
jgi:8-oxo-dGTP pyrophosphatase MutT (NUDIX family)